MPRSPASRRALSRLRLLLSAACAMTLAHATANAAEAATLDAYGAREVTRLDRFADWLRAGGVAGEGLVGEFGWPEHAEARKPRGGRYRTESLARWGALGRHYLMRVARHGLEATYWAGGEAWEPSYNKLAFGGRPLSFATAQGRTVSGTPGSARVRGVNLSQHEFATPRGYPAPASWAYLAGRGVRFVRLPFKWERLQPVRGRPLAAVELIALRETLDAAAAAGVQVVLDAHNYGVHRGVRMSGRDLAGLWRRLAQAFGGHRAVVGFDLMNEPNRDDMGYPDSATGAREWEAMSRQAVRAIRATGARQRIYVIGFEHGAPDYFAHLHPEGPWIRDPLRNTFYEAHHYWDEARNPFADPGSGRYDHEYAVYLERAEAAGFTAGGFMHGTPAGALDAPWPWTRPPA